MVSDEAIVLFSWKHMGRNYKHKHWQILLTKKMKGKQQEWWCNKQSWFIYCQYNKWYGSKQGYYWMMDKCLERSCRYGGWSPEGFNHFNKLVQTVQQDWAANTHFQAQYEIWVKEVSNNKKKKEKISNTNQLVVRAYQDLTLLGV